MQLVYGQFINFYPFPERERVVICFLLGAGLPLAWGAWNLTVSGAKGLRSPWLPSQMPSAGLFVAGALSPLGLCAPTFPPAALTSPAPVPPGGAIRASTGAGGRGLWVVRPLGDERGQPPLPQLT